MANSPSLSCSLLAPRPHLSFGEHSPTRDLFELDDCDPLPTSGHITLPAKLSPTIFSLKAAPRAWVPWIDGQTAVASLAEDGSCLTVLSTGKLHSTVIIYDSPEATKAALESDSDAANWWIGIPAKMVDNDVKPDNVLFNKFFKEAPIPPDPCFIPNWDPSADPLLPSSDDQHANVESDETRGPYLPRASDHMVLLRDKSTPVSDGACYMLATCFIRAPLGVKLPAGTVIDIEKLVPGELPNLLADMVGEERKTMAWLNNAYFTTWLKAVKSDPDAFCVQAVTHSQLNTLFPETAPAAAISWRRHLEWAILSQYIWDHAFATAVGGRSSSQSWKLTKYACCLVQAYNDCNDDNALSTKGGLVHSVFRHPFLARLRPLADGVVLENNKLCVLNEAPATVIPDGFKLCPVKHAPAIKKNQPYAISPILASPEDTEEDTLADQPIPNEDPSSPEKMDSGEPISQRTPKNYFCGDPDSRSESPPPYKRARTTTAKRAIALSRQPCVGFLLPETSNYKLPSQDVEVVPPPRHSLL